MGDAKTLDLDGRVHTRGGQCCKSGRWCPKCGGYVHTQSSTFGILEACEECDPDWGVEMPEFDRRLADILRMDPECCCICGTENGIHKLIKRLADGTPAICRGGDLRELAKRLRAATDREKEETALVQRLRDHIAKLNKAILDDLVTPEERKLRVNTLITLGSELVKIREVADQGIVLGETIIALVMDGRWEEVADKALKDLMFPDAKLNDLWSWFRASVLTAVVKHKDQTRSSTAS